MHIILKEVPLQVYQFAVCAYLMSCVSKIDELPFRISSVAPPQSFGPWYLLRPFLMLQQPRN